MSDISKHKDFFVSYSSPDKLWAEWITWQLEQGGYSVILQTWSFEPGQNFIQHMLDAISQTKNVIAVLSPDYLEELETHATWTKVFRQDPAETQGTVTFLPVQVRACQDQLKGVISLLSYIDLVGRDEDDARDVLLAGIRNIRSKSSTSLSYPMHFEHAATEQPVFPINFPRIWNVPSRNRFFTDRVEILEMLHYAFTSKKRAVYMLSQAISGLGGIGKTQIAIEYAYRYCDEYNAVLWLFAESRDMMVQSCHALVRVLDLPQKDAQDHEEIIDAVREWLRDHVDWLLILDNADDPSLISKFLPSAVSGHVLMTTRAQALGRIAQSIVVERMPLEEGTLFLLRRAGLLRPGVLLQDDPQWQDAERIVKEMDGLPLALDQAGGYIEETKCGLVEYLSLYYKHRKRLLGRRGKPLFDHPEPVTTTWNLSFERVQRGNSAAADLLRLCAFLAADDIPEEMIIEGTADVNSPLNIFADDPLAINEVIAELRHYSLIRRDSQNKTLSIHRLVQTVLKDMLSEEERRVWAERSVRAVNVVFPEVNFETWTQCQRYLSHARACIVSITQWQMVFPEAVSLLHRAGLYLKARAQYADAEQLLQQALAIYRQVMETDNDSIAHVLNDLAAISMNMGKYAEAEHYLKYITTIEQNDGSEHLDLNDTLNKLGEEEPLLQLALEIDEQVFGTMHSNTATGLNKLASLYQEQGRYGEAEPLYQRVLSINEEVLEARHPDTATSLNNLASLYQAQGKYSEAEPLYLRALSIREQVLGSNHPDTATSLNDLAILYRNQGKYAQAEPLLQRALAIREQGLDPHHPESLNNLGRLYYRQGKYAQAEPLLQRALAIREQGLNPHHPDIARSLNNLARLYYRQGKYAQAEPLLQRALAIREQMLGPNHPDIATSLNNLGALYHRQGKYAQAEPLLQRALAIREQMLGPNHPDTAISLNDLGGLYHSQGKYFEAESLLQRALAIREQMLGPNHPDTARSLSYLAYLYYRQGKYIQAEPLFQRALKTKEKVLGHHHPSTASSLNSLAVLYHNQGKYVQAELLFQRAFAIREQMLGHYHPDTATSLNNLASLYQTQGKYSEAEPLYQHALTIDKQVLGSRHPDTATSLNNLASLYQTQGKYSEAEPLYKEALSIRKQVLGTKHLDTVHTRNALSDLLHKLRSEGEDSSRKLTEK